MPAAHAPSPVLEPPTMGNMEASGANIPEQAAYQGKPLAVIDLVDDPSQQGQTEYTGEGRYDSELSGFSISVLEMNAVHGSGTWKSKKGIDETHKASLLIFRLKMTDTNRSRNRRIKNFVLRLRFKSADSKAKPDRDPWLATYAPAQENQVGLLKTSVLRSKKLSGTIKFDVDANPAPIVLGAELGADTSWEWEKDVWAVVSGSEHQSPFSNQRQGRHNVVQWAISENQSQQMITDSIDVAVLLRRPDDSPFIVEFEKTKATIDLSHSIAAAAKGAGNAVRDLVGEGTLQKRSHTYDPVKDEDGMQPPGVQPTALHEVEDVKKLEKFAFLHVLGDVRGIRY
ncbi:hypothetical protein BR93DRAFT_930161 [Coniochaeta sp. PMI_546]|nr:hypothetical protein BR93DRAFT_930161 [Coniochaeta sp. PMI_546]